MADKETIQAKYQKLAAEYAKIRAQLPVLKKAVLDEQAKEEDLKGELKFRDQSLRKNEQEIESLTFRNQQLAARVTSLQEDLSGLSGSGKKKPKRSASNSHQHLPHHTSDGLSNSVLGEELQSKIEENARLHKQVYEETEEHQSRVTELEEKLMMLEAASTQHQHILDSSRQESQARIDRLTEDKVVTEVKLQQAESEAKGAVQRASLSEGRLKETEQTLGGQLEAATATIKNKLPFNDTECPELNSLNVPRHDRHQQLQTQELLTQATLLIHDLIVALSNFYTYCEQRSQVYPVASDIEPVSDINRRLCKHLHENTTYLRPVEQSFKLFCANITEDSLTTLETADGLQYFAEKWKAFVVYASKLLPYQLLSLEEECGVSACPATLEAKNMELHSALKRFSLSLDRLSTYISLIAQQSGSGGAVPQSSQPRVFDLLSAAVSHFHDTTKEVSHHFNAKVSMEHHLPTVTTKLKTTDECIVSALISMVTCTSKLSAFLTGSLEFFHQVAASVGGVSGPVAQVHPIVNTLRQRTASYIASIPRASVESVPYITSVQNREMLYSSTENSASLVQQVAAFQQRVQQLEVDKEHWILESQLTQMKHQKEQQKVQDLERKVQLLETRLTGSIEDNLESTPNASLSLQGLMGAPGAPVPSGTSPKGDTSMLGGVVSSCHDGDTASRENLIKHHYAERVAMITTNLQLAESKSLHFHAECRALNKRLGVAQRDKEQAERELSTTTHTIAQLKDELATTKKSYEDQLSIMSEHLAGVNENLTSQKDEIDVLRYQLNSSKSVKKGRLK